MRRRFTLDSAAEFVLRAVSAAHRSHFAEDPLQSLSADFGLRAHEVPEIAAARDDGGFCDGTSFIEDGVILYAPTPYSRRQNFTLAHELGHVLIERCEPVLDWVADADIDGVLLETLCDRIAQQLLLPEAAIDAVVGAEPPSAMHVRELFEGTSASEPVCMIAIAKRIRGLGAIALVDRVTGEVSAASVRPDLERGWPEVFPWRGQSLRAGHRFLSREEGQTFIERERWKNRWGNEAEFFINGLVGPTKLILAFAESNIWDRGSADPFLERDFSTQLLLRGHCCGEPFETRGYPCPSCRGPFCPACKQCRCDKTSARAVTCNECFTQRPAHLVEGGVCDTCRG